MTDAEMSSQNLPEISHTQKSTQIHRSTQKTEHI